MTEPGRASLQLRGDQEFLRRVVVLHAQNVRLAADLAIFDIALVASGGLVDRGGIPFSAGRALETRFHLQDSIAHVTEAVL